MRIQEVVEITKVEGEGKCAGGTVNLLIGDKGGPLYSETLQSNSTEAEFMNVQFR
jgi:hypothetical protein